MGNHRADVLARGWVLEFQHSPLSVEEIREREEFYGQQMMWLVDGSACFRNFHFRPTKKHGPALLNRTPVSFRWKWPRKTWATVRRPLFLDIGGGLLLRIRWMSSDVPCGGWGVLTPAPAFVNWVQKGSSPFRPFQGTESNVLAEELFWRQRIREGYDNYCEGETDDLG